LVRFVFVSHFSSLILVKLMIGWLEHIFVWFFDFYWLTGSFDLVIFSKSLARGRLPICSGNFTVLISILSIHPPFFRFPRGGVGWCSEQKVTPLGVFWIVSQ
jgi:hypothetical protein